MRRMGSVAAGRFDGVPRSFFVIEKRNSQIFGILKHDIICHVFVT